jgi:flagella basal body P-ring formation protein FlgA
MSPRILTLLSRILAFVALGFVVQARAESPANAASLTRDQFVSAITRDVAAHFSLEGDLQIELIRPWTAPAQTAGSWTVSVAEFPNAATSSMMLRYRVAADGKVVDDSTIVVRAALWRDAWATKMPLTIGATFDAAELEARRVDMFRERDALPATIGGCLGLLGSLFVVRAAARRTGPGTGLAIVRVLPPGETCRERQSQAS